MLDVPERPKNLKPDEVRAEHIKMSWQKPDDDGGSPITGYVLRMMDLEAGNWITIDEVCTYVNQVRECRNNCV